MPIRKLTVKEFAKATGMAYNTVRAKIRRGDLPAQKYGGMYYIRADWIARIERRKPRKWTKEEEDFTVKMSQEGLRAKDISPLIHRSAACIWRRWSKMGYKPRHSRVLIEDDRRADTRKNNREKERRPGGKLLKCKIKESNG